MVYADVCYGCYLTYDPGEVDHDAIEEFENNGAHTAYSKNRGYTVWYGVNLSTITEASASINDPRMFLNDENSMKDKFEEVKKIMGEVPVELRKKMTPPRFFLAWGES